MCFSCSGQALMLDPVPADVAAMKLALSRDRRATERRFGKLDSRVFRYERRVGQRRAGRVDDDCALIEDDMIIEIVIDFDEPADFEDQTRIRELATSF
jgi:hypothetical protein